MKYSEETLKNWKNPASDTEEQKISNTISMIKSAVANCPDLDDLTIEVFVQGSYANNTNVRTNSDVDVCVMLTSSFYTEYPEGKSREDYGFTEGSISFAEYKKRIKKAIIDKFGSDAVTVGNKSLKIRSNSYHVNADVVVAIMLKDYKSIGSTDPKQYSEGTRFWSSDGTKVTNYPKIHIANGIKKNNETNYRYKYLVRMFISVCLAKNVRVKSIRSLIVLLLLSVQNDENSNELLVFLPLFLLRSCSLIWLKRVELE